jgi:dihydrofolate synthase/folylpolyglutamate synthase
MDHMEYLGNTVEEIARTKSGIIKPNSSVVLAAQPPEVAKILLEKAGLVDATPFRQGVEFGVKSRALAYGGQQISLAGIYGSYDEIFLPLYGAHQAENASLALAAVEAFVGKELDIEAVRIGFANATSPGRLEVAHSDPTVLIDAAHNPHGAVATAKTLREEFDFAALYGVIAMLGDKDVKGFLETMEPVLDRVIVTTNSSARAMAVEELEKLAISVFGPGRVSSEQTLERAISRAIEETSTLNQVSELSNGVVVTGSVITAGEAKTILRRK